MRTNDIIAQLRWMRRRTSTFYRRVFLGFDGVDPLAFVAQDCLIFRDLVLGAYAYVGPGCQIYPRVNIGRYSMLAGRSAVLGSDHRMDQVGVPMIFSGREELPATHIGRDVWVGFGAVIRCGVTIGDGAVIAARSVVTKDVAPYEVVAGVPARPIRTRFSESEAIVHQKMLDGPIMSPKFASSLRDFTR